jgi:hypothetical protein
MTHTTSAEPYILTIAAQERPIHVTTTVPVITGWIAQK